MTDTDDRTVSTLGFLNFLRAMAAKHGWGAEVEGYVKDFLDLSVQEPTDFLNPEKQQRFQPYDGMPETLNAIKFANALRRAVDMGLLEIQDARDLASLLPDDLAFQFQFQPGVYKVEFTFTLGPYGTLSGQALRRRAASALYEGTADSVKVEHF